VNHSTRTLLMAGATVAAALSLTLSPVAAQDEEATSDDMDTMAPMEEMEPGLYVMGAWTRESPMMDLPGAAYMVIHNNTDAEDALVGASSPVAEFVELHLSSMDAEGKMSMNQVTEIPLPAHADAELKPGSYHIMLIDLVEPLTEGVEVELTLEFMTAEPQTVIAPVMAGAPMMDMEMDDMSEDMEMDDEMDSGTAEMDESMEESEEDEE
jgi:copper(I)-binding protein